MRPMTPQEASVPAGFDGLCDIARRDGAPIFAARITQWTDHGIVIVYDTTRTDDSARTLQPVRLRRFIPFHNLLGVVAPISTEATDHAPA